MEGAKTFLKNQINNSEVPADLKNMLGQVLNSVELEFWNGVGANLLSLVKQLQKGDDLWQLYTNVIEKMESKLEPLVLVDISMFVANTLKDVNLALNFLKHIGKCVEAEPNAFVMLNILIGRFEITRNLDAAKSIGEVIDRHMDKVTSEYVQKEAGKLKQKISDGENHISMP